jgi:hypothetical protein
MFCCTLLFTTVLSGCAVNSATTVIQHKSGYFPEGLTIDGTFWSGEYYVLSAEAYEAMFQ